MKTSILILLNPAKKIFFHLFYLSFFDKELKKLVLVKIFINKKTITLLFCYLFYYTFVVYSHTQKIIHWINRRHRNFPGTSDQKFI